MFFFCGAGLCVHRCHGSALPHRLHRLRCRQRGLQGGDDCCGEKHPNHSSFPSSFFLLPFPTSSPFLLYLSLSSSSYLHLLLSFYTSFLPFLTPCLLPYYLLSNLPHLLSFSTFHFPHRSHLHFLLSFPNSSFPSIPPLPLSSLVRVIVSLGCSGLYVYVFFIEYLPPLAGVWFPGDVDVFRRRWIFHEDSRPPLYERRRSGHE